MSAAPRISPHIREIAELMLGVYMNLRDAMADETDPRLMELMSDLSDIMREGPAETFVSDWLEKTHEIMDVWGAIIA